MKIKDGMLLQVSQQEHGIEIIVADQMTEQELTVALLAIVSHNPRYLSAIIKAVQQSGQTSTKHTRKINDWSADRAAYWASACISVFNQWACFQTKAHTVFRQHRGSPATVFEYGNKRVVKAAPNQQQNEIREPKRWIYWAAHQRPSPAHQRSLTAWRY